MLNPTIRRWLACALLGGSLAVTLTAPALGEDARKIKNKVTPTYPELANRMHVTGSVKIEVTIAPNGEVTKTKVIGGHPLLVQAALDALKKWKYESGTSESTAVVQFDFKGQ